MAGIFSQLHLIDVKNQETHKVAEVERRILSIQLLSKEHSLALAIEWGGKVKLINYTNGNNLLLTTVSEWYSGVHLNSLLQVLNTEDDSLYYKIICLDGEKSISKFKLSKLVAHNFKS